MRLRELLAKAMRMVDLTFPRSKTAKQKARAANQSWIRIARAPLPPMSCPHIAGALSCSERVSRCVPSARYDDRFKMEDGSGMNEWAWGVQHSKDSRSESTLSLISRLVFSSSAGAAGSSFHASLLSNKGFQCRGVVCIVQVDVLPTVAPP